MIVFCCVLPASNKARDDDDDDDDDAVVKTNVPALTSYTVIYNTLQTI